MQTLQGGNESNLSLVSSRASLYNFLAGMMKRPPSSEGDLTTALALIISLRRRIAICRLAFNCSNNCSCYQTKLFQTTATATNSKGFCCKHTFLKAIAKTVNDKDPVLSCNLFFPDTKTKIPAATVTPDTNSHKHCRTFSHVLSTYKQVQQTGFRKSYPSGNLHLARAFPANGFFLGPVHALEVHKMPL